MPVTDREAVGHPHSAAGDRGGRSASVLVGHQIEERLVDPAGVGGVTSGGRQLGLDPRPASAGETTWLSQPYS
jgi:hypothetical protein